MQTHEILKLKKKKETELNAERSRIETLKRCTSIKWVFAKKEKKKGRNKKRGKIEYDHLVKAKGTRRNGGEREVIRER